MTIYYDDSIINPAFFSSLNLNSTMQFVSSRQQTPVLVDQFGWQKHSSHQNDFNWEFFGDSNKGYLSPESVPGDHTFHMRSNSSDSSYSVPTEEGASALEAQYKSPVDIKVEDLSPIDLTSDTNIPIRKRPRNDFDNTDYPNTFNFAPSITIPSSPVSGLINPLSNNGLHSNPITPPDDISYSMLVQDALACFQPKSIVRERDDDEEDSEKEVGSIDKINRIAHNAIEKRYRNNINDCLTDLKNAVPALKFAKVKDNTIDDAQSNIDQSNGPEEELIDGVPVATKLNKATILRKATEYITHLKATLDQSESENKALQSLILQLPRGAEVVSYYRMQKQQFESYERERMALERQMAHERKQREKREARRKSKMLRRGQLTQAMSSRRQSSTSPSSQTFMALCLGMTLYSSSNYLKPVHNVSNALPHDAGSNSTIYGTQGFDFCSNISFSLSFCQVSYANVTCIAYRIHYWQVALQGQFTGEKMQEHGNETS
ncbi:helix-loop-helix DNA-binding domain-containing protein [Umbelopsis sp. PMI_123]|nr:helix-loop-helix DNA-binding domain-containing protein [Umbelopsis sp. PMI_123]